MVAQGRAVCKPKLSRRRLRPAAALEMSAWLHVPPPVGFNRIYHYWKRFCSRGRKQMEDGWWIQFLFQNGAHMTPTFAAICGCS